MKLTLKAVQRILRVNGCTSHPDSCERDNQGQLVIYTGNPAKPDQERDNDGNGVIYTDVFRWYDGTFHDCEEEE